MGGGGLNIFTEFLAEADTCLVDGGSGNGCRLVIMAAMRPSSCRGSPSHGAVSNVGYDIIIALLALRAHWPCPTVVSRKSQPASFAFLIYRRFFPLLVSNWILTSVS